MTLFGSTFLIYFLIGAGVAIAVYVSDMARTPIQRCFQTAACFVFWPLFVPLLLQKRSALRPAPPPGLPLNHELSKAIAQVEVELEEALSSVPGGDGVSGDVIGRLVELRSYWQAQGERIREMDRLLAQPEYTIPNDAIQSERPAVRDGTAASGRSGQRLDGIGVIAERLRTVRDENHTRLMDSLARVRQLAAFLQLARFTGEAGGESAELLRQVEDEIDRTTNHGPTTPVADGDSAARE
ncbi:MAG TPA: hypothetical protein VKE94_19935 [Gemmataceae bacterium]|nr:hypothetical protein [Gemmataceae bacterium]